MEHWLFWSKWSIFQNSFKYMIFKRCQKALFGVKGETILEDYREFGNANLVNLIFEQMIFRAELLCATLVLRVYDTRWG